MKLTKYFITTVLVLITCLCTAGELNLEDAVQTALKNNQTLLAKQADIHAAKADVHKAFWGLLPSASLDASYLYKDPKIDTQGMASDSSMGDSTDVPPTAYKWSSNELSIKCVQPILQGGKIFQNLQIKRALARIAKHTYTAQELETIKEAQSRYLAVLEAQELVANAHKSLASSKKHLNISKIRYETGELSKADYLRMQAETASSEVGLIQLENLWEISRIQLFDYLHTSASESIAPVDINQDQLLINALQKLDMIGIKNFAKKATAYGLNKNPQLMSAQESVTISNKTQNIAWGEFLPTLSLIYNLNWTDDFADNNRYDRTQTIMFNASLPIFPFFDNASGASSARYKARVAQYNYTDTRDNMSLAIKSASLDLAAAAKEIKGAALSKEYARETFIRTEERFNNKLVSASNMLDAEVIYTAAQNKYTTSVYSFLKKKLKLLSLLGVQHDDVLASLVREEK